MARLKELYKAEIAPALMKKFTYKSVMQIPKLDKIVVNVGVGDAKDNSKALDAVLADLPIITGQKAIPTTAKKSVANFKIRQGMKIGANIFVIFLMSSRVSAGCLKKKDYHHLL